MRLVTIPSPIVPLSTFFNMTDSTFDLWNQEKKHIHKHDIPNVYINTREIWFTKMGKNVGFEQDGKDEFLRPVLVLKKVGNLFFTVALTSKEKINSSFYHKLEEVELDKKNKKYKNSSHVILSQVRVMDKKRFTQHIGIVAEKEFKTIKQKLRTLLF